MRHHVVLFQVLALLLLAGCNSVGPVETGVYSTSEPDAPSSVTTKTVSEDDILCMFNAEHPNDSATDCVVADDAAYDLIGIVQFTDDVGNPCNLAFVYKDGWSYPLGVVAEDGFSAPEESALFYLGNGKVTLSFMENETQKIVDYTVGYSTNGSHTHFESSSIERT